MGDGSLGVRGIGWELGDGGSELGNGSLGFGGWGMSE